MSNILVSVCFPMKDQPSRSQSRNMKRIYSDKGQMCFVLERKAWFNVIIFILKRL